MSPSRFLVLTYLLPLLAVSWLLLAVIDPDAGPGVSQHVAIAFLLGTMFGQATLAAGWNALGPLPLVWRMPLSLLWIAVLILGLLINVANHSGGSEIEVVLIMAVCLAGQWLLVQIPLWGLAIGYGIRLRYRDDVEMATSRDRQFGIRQLMILTAIVAVVLGICRWAIVATTTLYPQSNWAEAGIFIFLAAAGVVMTVPLLVAALLPRFALLATTAVLALIAIATWWELPLVNMAGGGPNFAHLVFLNTFQAAWVVGVIALLRYFGYAIGRYSGECPFAGDNSAGKAGNLAHSAKVPSAPGR